MRCKLDSKASIVTYMQTLEGQLIASIEKRERKLAKMPEGILKCYVSRNAFTWYKITFEVDEKGKKHRKREAINKKNSDEAEQLAIKGFHEDALAVERRRLFAVRQFLKHYDSDVPGLKYLEKNDEYMRLAGSEIKSKSYSKEELEWMSAERPYKQTHMDDLIVPCVFGYFVRSKSEAEYLALFAKYGVVVRYEWPIKFEGYPYPVFPDFTILVPSTGEVFYCEHFGKMDQEKYVRDNAEKLRLYFLNGIYPNERLVMSYETKGKKFTSLDAEQIIKNEILPRIKNINCDIAKEAFWIE